MKKMFLMGIPLALALTGCVKPEQTTTTGPSGKTMSVAKCSQRQIHVLAPTKFWIATAKLEAWLQMFCQAL